MKRTGQVMPLALLFALFSSSSRADVGSLGGLVIPALVIALTFWSCLTLGVFLLLRRLSKGRRIGGAVLFFFAPVLLLALTLLKEYAFGESTSELTETARKPVLVAGATFPAGSRAHYEQTGGFFGWHAQRTLLDVRSVQPVLLGKVRVDALKTDRYSTQLVVDLHGDQMLDGWPCAGGEYTILYATSSGYELSSCWLAAPHEWGGKVVPAGTYVMRNGDDGWLFAVMPKPTEDSESAE